MPSFEYARVFVAPLPTATHRIPFHAIPDTKVEKIVFPNPVQLMPSFEYARVFSVVPLPPPATHRVPFHTILYADPFIKGDDDPNPVQDKP